MRFVNSLTILRNRHICCLLEHPTTILTTGFYVQSSRERARILTLNLPTACLQFDKDGRQKRDSLGVAPFFAAPPPSTLYIPVFNIGNEIKFAIRDSLPTVFGINNIKTPGTEPPPSLATFTRAPLVLRSSTCTQRSSSDGGIIAIPE
ncbi:hypothetical protein V9T40_002990 [Parthenolecanium corni]|uniref:Uncharacterized protein n=1 Tax=Parthenolecanium corni TaxID=536013 RepID=A0AAN9Y8G6_9HEMI